MGSQTVVHEFNPNPNINEEVVVVKVVVEKEAVVVVELLRVVASCPVVCMQIVIVKHTTIRSGSD